ncbi:hypothetical protein ACFQV4_18080 [Streptomyces thermocarboxydus]
MRELAGRDGPVDVPGRSPGRALALRGPGGAHGYLVVTCRSRPTDAHDVLLAMLVRLTAAALGRRRAPPRQEDALELHRLRRERATLQQRMISLVVEAGHQRAVHQALADVAASGGGQEAITGVLHELTGFPVLLEDRFGRCGPGPAPASPTLPGPRPARHEEVLQQAARRADPCRSRTGSSA